MVYLTIFLLSLIGFAFLLTDHLIFLSAKSTQEEVYQLKEKIQTDYRSRFYEIDATDEVEFAGYTNLQQYCTEAGLHCKPDWSWRIQVIDQDIYRYRTVSVVNGNGLVLFSVSGQPIWSEYLTQVDSVIGTFCSNLYDYGKLMSEKAAADLNWYARSEGGCYYDSGVNEVVLGQVRIEKEIRCSNAVANDNGWATVSDANATVIGGIFRLATGEIEIKNTNSIYTQECGAYGLSDTAPPYAVAVRIKLLPEPDKYYQICCGF